MRLSPASLFARGGLLAALLLGFVSVRAETPAEPTPENWFRSFTGVCQGMSLGEQLHGFVGWDREDVPWARLEPAPGEWKQAELEKWGERVLALKARGIEFLPLLAYCAPWAVDTEPRVALENETSRTELQRNAAGDLVIAVYKKAHNGSWVRESAKVARPRAQWALAEKHVPDWEAYVRRVVSFLSAPPYDVKYFQIWNEAHPASGFWELGSMDDYMRRIHLPAAKIIRELGGKVVYGGWPDGGPIKDYIAMLDRHDAWRTIDVHDIHYLPISSFETIRKAARERGLGSVPLWQTEIGFVKNTGTIPNTWPRFLAWALRNDWTAPDDYKLFWFPAGTPDDPRSYGYGRALYHGKAITAHGRALRTLGELFSVGRPAVYPGAVASKPALKAEISPTRSSMEVFRIGEKRLLAAVHLVREKDDRDFARLPLLDLRFDGVRATDISRIQRVDMAGGATELAAFDPLDARGTTLRVPVPDAGDCPALELFANATMLTFYVVLDLK